MDRRSEKLTKGSLCVLRKGHPAHSDKFAGDAVDESALIAGPDQDR